MFTGTGYAAAGAETELAPVTVECGDPRADDVATAWCGVCRSDRHRACDAWRNTRDPCVPGQPIAGRATSSPRRAARSMPAAPARPAPIVSSPFASRASLQRTRVRNRIIDRASLPKAA